MLSQTSYQYLFLIDSSSVSSSAQSTSPSILRSRADTKYLSSPLRTMTSTDTSAARASGSPTTTVNNILNDGKKNGKKNVPFEFTAQGTTPSGKPRLFVCQVCTRAFARLEHLRRHERSHTKEKPFSCGVCQRKFSRRDLLLRHAQKLHAGCSDAITRLRRKSIKRSNNSSATGNNDDEDIYEIDDEDDDEDVDMDREKVSPTKKSANMTFPTQSLEPQFKLNGELSPNPYGQRTGPQHTPRRNSITHEAGTPLQRQMFDQRKKIFNTRNRRGASFSAQSGANYASGMPEFNDMYPNPENVEFSTPQMLPSSMNDEINWLNNLSSIPGMSNIYNEPQQPDKFVPENLPSYDMRQNSISNVLDNHTNPPPNVSHHGSFSHSLASSHTPQEPQFSESASHIPFMMPTATTTTKEINQGISATYARNNSNPPIKNESSDYGYSFYDIPDSMVNMNGITGMDTNGNMPNLGILSRANSHMYKVLTPIKQEIEEEIAHNERAGNSQPENFDLNFLNDIDELTQGIDVNSRFLPNGYSFYGDNGSVSSSGMETNSPSVLSPSLQLNMNVLGNYDSTLDHNQLLDIERTLPGQSPHRRAPPNQNQNPNQNEYNHIQINTHRVKSGNFSTNKLFTNNLRQMIHRSLGKYPISGVVNPSIPSNEKLEFYLSKFVSEFLTHLPFIHQSKLNEYEMMNMTVNEDWNNESARVCLPLLIATIGALLANHKRDSEHLYEASRRTIHIYLESRKSSVGNNNDKTNGTSTVNPLWLIQSLMLSVIYGLFSDNENNVYIVIRQLSALNSLVKTSIKSKRSILFSVSGEDEESFNKIKTETDNGSLFSNSTHQEQKFRNNVNVQAQTRIVLTIYRLTNFLLMMYNVPLTLSVNDLAGVTLPNRQDEFLWNFKTFQEFQEFSTKNGGVANIDNYLNGERLNYKDFLFQLIKMDTVDIGSLHNQNVFKQLEHLSKFGFSSITHGLYELKQYQETKLVDIFVILDTIAKFFPSKHLQSHSSAQEDSHRFDFALLANFTKLSSMIDLKSIQEQSWLRNYAELTKNYSKFLSDNNPNNKAIDDYDYLRIVDCCLMIIRLVLFKYEDHYEDDTVQDAAHGNGLSGFSTDFGFLNNGFESSNVLGGSSFLDLNSLLGEASRNYGKARNGEENTIAQFEKSLNIRVTDEFEITSISMHSQMLFHAFTILSIFSIYISRRNNSVNNATPNQNLLFELNSRFSTTLKLLDKVENYLKTHYQQQGNEGVKNEVLDQFFSNLYLYNGNLDARKNDNENNYTLEKTLYILKIGEVVLNFLFDRNIKVSIFKKLSGSLAQIRKSLIDNEATVLG